MLAAHELSAYSTARLNWSQKGDSPLEQLRGGVAGIPLGDVLPGRQPQELGEAEIDDLQPAVVEYQRPRIQAQMLQAVLLEEVIETSAVARR